MVLRGIIRTALSVAGLVVVLGVQAANAALDCTADVTAKSTVVRSGYRLVRREAVVVQTISIKNSGTSAIQGPVNLMLSGLPEGVALVGGTATSCPGMAGVAIEVGAGSVTSFLPGATVRAVLKFSNPALKRISYQPRVFASPGLVQPIPDVTVSPDGYLVNTNTVITFKAKVPYPPNQGIPNVTVERVDANGVSLGAEGTMVDNGNLSQGDEIAGDGVFTLRKSYLSLLKERIRLRVSSIVSGQLRQSNIFFLDALEPTPQTTISTLLLSQKSLLQLFNQSISTGAGQAGGLQAVMDALKTDPSIAQFGTSESGNGVWMLYKSGILGGLMLNPVGTRGGTSFSQAPFPASVTSNAAALATAAAVANVEVGSTKVLILSPFLFDFGTTDEGPVLNTLYSASSCPKYDVTYVSNAQVTVETMKTLANYGVVHLSTHGDTYYNGLTGDAADFFDWAQPGSSQVVFLLSQPVTTANQATYQVDLQTGRLAIINGFYAVLPSFIQAYVGSMSNALVFGSSCRSTKNQTMSSVFLSKGAKTFMGFSEYVASSFAYTRATDFHTKWVNDPNNLVTTGEIFTPGLSDGSSPPAFWEMKGASDLALPTGNALRDGDFESGNLNAWTTSGDGRVISQLGEFSPTGGSHMGIISTGLGFTTDSGSLSQKVCVPTNAKTLTFKWNFNSEEFLSYCSSIFQDFFRVSIGSTTLLNRRIDDLCSSVRQTSLAFDQGDVWTTEWQSATIDISGIAAGANGSPITLEFSAGDVGDSIYDTAILIDDIKFNQ